MATSFEPPIRRVVIEAFRGFRDRQEFDLGASAIVVEGPNGTGKTSFFDAFQWCLVGTIARLEGLRAKRNVEHIVNQYRLGGSASVELELLINGQRISIRRTGDRSGTTFEYSSEGQQRFGSDAETALRQVLVNGDALTLDMALTTSGLMQQDVMRGILEARPAERYRHVSTVLGLGTLEDFEGAVHDAAKEAAVVVATARTERDGMAAAAQAAEERLATAKHRLESRPRVEVLGEQLGQLLQRAPLGLSSTGSTPDSADQFRALAIDAGTFIEGLSSFLRERNAVQALVATMEPEPTEAELVTANAAVSDSAEKLKDLDLRLATAESSLITAQKVSQDIARLAALAIPLLGASCPVCSQPIDPSEIERTLRKRLSETQTVLDMQKELDEIRAESRSVKTQLAAGRSSASSIAETRRAWSEFRRRSERLADLAIQFSNKTGYFRLTQTDTSTVAEMLPAIIDFLSMVQRETLRIVDTLAQDQDRGQFETATSELASFEKALGARNLRLEELALRAGSLKSLAEATVDARVEVTERRFKAVQPLVADIYSRLDPHPAFKTIEFELETYYRKGTTSALVRDVLEGISADPLVVFSTSQANIAALSYFLAMGWSAGDRSLPFVLLDDPVQSMDDVNVLGFADLCRHLRTSRQLIISTHERRFAGLLERKLAPRTEQSATQVIEFVGWDRSGPIVETRIIEPQITEQPIRIVKATA